MLWILVVFCACFAYRAQQFRKANPEGWVRFATAWREFSQRAVEVMKG